jgi:excisionase family DNA binding protein
MLLKTAEVAQRLNCTRQNVQHLVEIGKLASTKTALGHRIFKSQDVEKFLEERARAAEERGPDSIKDHSSVRMSEGENLDFSVAVYLLNTKKNKLLRKYIQDVIEQAKAKNPGKFAEVKEHFIEIWRKQGRLPTVDSNLSSDSPS